MVNNNNKMVQNCLKMVQNGSKWFKMVQSGLKWSDWVQNGTVKKKVKMVQNGQFFSSKWSNMLQIHLKLFHKIIAVGVKAVGVTAVRNNLKS